MIDGALFALVSNAGTDPEVLLLDRGEGGEGKLRWEYACGRFSDGNCTSQRKDKEVWSSIPGDDNPSLTTRSTCTASISDKIVSAGGEVARPRPTHRQGIRSRPRRGQVTGHPERRDCDERS